MEAPVALIIPTHVSELMPLNCAMNHRFRAPYRRRQCEGPTSRDVQTCPDEKCG